MEVFYRPAQSLDFNTFGMNCGKPALIPTNQCLITRHLITRTLYKTSLYNMSSDHIWRQKMAALNSHTQRQSEKDNGACFGAISPQSNYRFLLLVVHSKVTEVISEEWKRLLTFSPPHTNIRRNGHEWLIFRFEHTQKLLDTPYPPQFWKEGDGFRCCSTIKQLLLLKHTEILNAAVAEWEQTPAARFLNLVKFVMAAK